MKLQSDIQTLLLGPFTTVTLMLSPSQYRNTLMFLAAEILSHSTPSLLNLKHSLNFFFLISSLVVNTLITNCVSTVSTALGVVSISQIHLLSPPIQLDTVRALGVLQILSQQFLLPQFCNHKWMSESYAEKQTLYCAWWKRKAAMPMHLCNFPFTITQ